MSCWPATQSTGSVLNELAERVDVIPGEQARIRLHSGDTRYSVFEYDLGEINIVGRVVLAAKHL